MKDSLKGQVLLKGLAEKGLYRLLLNSTPSSQSSSFLSHISSSKPLLMLSFYPFKSDVPADATNNVVALKLWYRTTISFCNASVNKAVLFHRKFGYPNCQVLMHMLKSIKSVHIPIHQIQKLHQYTCEACQMGKIHILHFPSTYIKTSNILELIHTDL